MCKFIKNYLELIFVFITSIIATLILASANCFDEVLVIFTSNGLNQAIISLYGGLLGLVIAVYAIVFGIAPALNKDLVKSTLFLRTNKYFLITAVTALLSLAFGLLAEFVISSGLFFRMLFISLFFLSIFMFQMVLIIIIILFLLLNVSRKEITRKK